MPSVLSPPGPVIFRPSRLAHQFLQGLRGIEIGASAHNSFGLETLNVDYTDATDTSFKLDEMRLCGQMARVDIVAPGDALPLEDKSVDFVVSSHVVEHFFDPIKALKEWSRVARKYIYIICPQPDAHPGDCGLPLTPWQELLDRHSGRIRAPDVDDHGHYTRWNAVSFTGMCRELGFAVVAVQDPDDKAGNGFAVVLDLEASQKSLLMQIPERAEGVRHVYYHVAALNHWREVVVEQLGVLWHYGYRGVVKVGLVAGPYEHGYLWRCVEHLPGLELEIVHHREGLDQFEFPTLDVLEADCRAGRCDEVVYFHTKGVSQPGQWNAQQWRWLMNADLLTRAGDPTLLADADLVGSSYCHHYVPKFPHFSGNFWAAKASYIRSLPSFWEFRTGFKQNPHVPGWMAPRHAAELWAGAGPQPPRIRAFRAPNLVLHDTQFYASRPELQDELMRVHLRIPPEIENAVPAERFAPSIEVPTRSFGA